MSNLTEIKFFEVLAGTEIEEAVKEAIKIATDNNCIVCFDFNEIKMTIYYFSKIHEEVSNYHDKICKEEI